MIGDGSNLKVGKLENTAAAIGTTGSGKLSIDEYVGHDLENVDKLKTVGGSVGVSASGITSLGVNYSDRKQEGITKNTVIGNVEIGKSSGDEINRDLDTMTEITEDRDFKTNVNVESQTINYIKNPEKFKEDLQKAKNEVEDLENAVKNTSNPLGKDKRNIFANLRAQRWSTSYYNVIGSRVEELGRQFKAGTINKEDLKEALRDIVKGYGKDIGIDFDVVYLDEKTMPKDSEGSTGSSYIVDRKNRKVLIPIDVNKIEDIKELLGTTTEEVAHGKDALEGRQDKKVAEDKSNDEEGLESLGRPANEYVKKKFGEDNNSKIKLTTDGIDLSNADVGEKVGDVENENYEIATFGSAFSSAGIGLIGIGGLSLSLENKEAIKKVRMQVYEDIKESLNKSGNNIRVSYLVVKALIEEKLKEKGIEADVKIDKDRNIIYTMTPLPKEKRVFKIPPMVPPKQETPKERWEREERFRREQKERVFKIPPMVPPKQETPKERWEREERFRREQKERDNERSKPNGIPLHQERPVTVYYTEKTKKERGKVKTNTDTSITKIEVETPKIRPVEDIIGTKTGNKELNNAINTRGAEYYLDLRAQKATAPINFNGHIINGEINAGGRAVGGHSTLGGNVKIEHLHSVSSNGVRTADISVFDQNTNQWKLKVKRDGITPQETTLFPESWTESRIIVEVDIAYKNKIISQTRHNIWEGTTPSGIKVEGYIAPNTTVFPLP